MSHLAALDPGAAGDFVVLAWLAVLQGLTEFLPISSSGHLVLAQEAFGLEHAPLALDVALHVGTLLSVLVVYGGVIVELVRGLFKGAWREPLLIVVATLPVVAIGLAFENAIEARFGDPRFAAACLVGTAAILTVGELGRRRRLARAGSADDDVPATGDGSRLTLGRALFVGVAQCLAILPGISRSGTTIAAGLLIGLDPKTAARLSFLLSVPAVAGAAVLKLPEALGAVDAPGIGALTGAILIAALVGWVCLRLLLAFLGRGAFAWFALYCAAVGGGYLAFA